jgi:hypothetical protein
MNNLLTYFVALGILGIPVIGSSQMPSNMNRTPAVEQNTMNRPVQPSNVDQNIQTRPNYSDTRMDVKDNSEFDNGRMHDTRVYNRGGAIDVNIDHRNIDGRVDRVDRVDRNFYSWRDPNNTTVVRFRDAFRSDKVLLPYAESVDFVQCGDTTIVFGVVSSPEIKANIENKLRSLDGVSKIENRIIVK